MQNKQAFERVKVCNDTRRRGAGGVGTGTYPMLGSFR